MIVMIYGIPGHNPERKKKKTNGIKSEYKKLEKKSIKTCTSLKLRNTSRSLQICFIRSCTKVCSRRFCRHCKLFAALCFTWVWTISKEKSEQFLKIRTFWRCLHFGIFLDEVCIRRSFLWVPFFRRFFDSVFFLSELRSPLPLYR